MLERNLRLLIQTEPELRKEREKLRILIKEYESLHWTKSSEIDEAKLKESDLAELIAEAERLFIEKRKQIIKEKLAKYSLSQQDLGTILGHGKTYMSELVNGLSPFSMRDLIIIHHLFRIKLEDLVPAIISEKDLKKIRTSLAILNKPTLKLDSRVLMGS